MSEEGEGVKIPGKRKTVLPRFSVDGYLDNIRQDVNEGEEEHNKDALDEVLEREDRELARETKRTKVETILLEHRKKKMELEADLEKKKSEQAERPERPPKTAAQAAAAEDLMERPEVVKMLSEIESDEKREKALDMLIEYRLRTANPQMETVKMVTDMMKGAPEDKVKATDPIELLDRLFSLYKKMKEEVEGGKGEAPQIITAPEREKSWIEEFIEGEAKELLIKRLKGEGSPPSSSTGKLIYDTQAKMWIKQEPTYQEYREVEDMRWKRIQDLEQKKEERRRTDMVRDHVLKPGMEYLKPLIEDLREKGREKIKGRKGREKETVETEKGTVLPCKCGEEIKIDTSKGWPERVTCPSCGTTYKTGRQK